MYVCTHKPVMLEERATLKGRWPGWAAATNLSQHEDPIAYEDLLGQATPWAAQIELDIGRTFPELDEFDAEQQQCLGRVLCAYAAYRPEVGYCQGMNFVAAFLLLASGSEVDTFNALVCLMGKYGLAGFYRESLPLLRQYIVSFDRLIAQEAPLLRRHFQEQGIHPEMYLHEWFLTLFVNSLPHQEVLSIWDLLLRDGLPTILSVSVSILKEYESTLLPLQFEGIIQCLKSLKLGDFDQVGSHARLLLNQAILSADEINVPHDLFADVEPGASDILEEPVEDAVRQGSWLHSLSRSIAKSLSPKKRNKKRADISCKHTSPEAGTELTCPSKRGQLCLHRRPTLRPLRPKLFTFSTSSEFDEVSGMKLSEQHTTRSSSSHWQCCTTSASKAGSPVRRGCTSSPVKRGLVTQRVTSPLKQSCPGSPTKQGCGSPLRRPRAYRSMPHE